MRRPRISRNFSLRIDQKVELCRIDVLQVMYMSSFLFKDAYISFKLDFICCLESVGHSLRFQAHIRRIYRVLNIQPSNIVPSLQTSSGARV